MKNIKDIEKFELKKFFYTSDDDLEEFSFVSDGCMYVIGLFSKISISKYTAYSIHLIIGKNLQ